MILITNSPYRTGMGCFVYYINQKLCWHGDRTDAISKYIIQYSYLKYYIYPQHLTNLSPIILLEQTN